MAKHSVSFSMKFESVGLFLTDKRDIDRTCSSRALLILPSTIASRHLFKDEVADLIHKNSFSSENGDVSSGLNGLKRELFQRSNAFKINYFFEIRFLKFCLIKQKIFIFRACCKQFSKA